MEHIIITHVQGSYFRLAPAAGYLLYNIPSGRFVSEAVVKEKQFGQFRAESIAV